MAKYTAIVLSAGKGSRMGSSVHKQYLLLCGKPVIYYTLKAFEESTVDEIVLVTGEGEEEYCRKEIVEKYKLHKEEWIPYNRARKGSWQIRQWSFPSWKQRFQGLWW